MDDRLFGDPFALKLLAPAQRALVRLLLLPVLGPALLSLRERQIPGITGNLWCRTRFIDDQLRMAIACGIEQVLILGAGLDSRAFRIPGADRVSVFEVDHPATQAWKLERIRRAGLRIASHVTYVAVDFEQQDLGEALTAKGFDPGATTFTIWEGVTQYIGEAAVESTLRWLSESTAPRSEVVFTYIRLDLVDGSTRDEATGRLLAALEKQGEPWVFGIEPANLARFLAALGFDLLEDTGAPEYRQRYLAPTGRQMALFEGERVAVARVGGRQ